MVEYIERESTMQIAFSSPFFSNALMEEIKAIPAVDVAPVVHGKWLNIDGDYTFAACSICSEEYEVATEGEAEKGLWSAYLSAYRYCPNCGAKMDEE